MKGISDKKIQEEIIMSSDILFLEDTAVIHVSGNRDSPGRIVKTNQGLTKIFGYSKSEVVGHLINILMPSIFAKRHSEIMESFFKTGQKTLFNSEQILYGLHRNGFCFQIKILVKQMPSLQEGIQYVGFIRQTFGESEIILTDTRGVIDSFSSGLSAVFNLPVSLFKDSDLNIQLLAPELICALGSQEKKRALLEKFKESGGQKLCFIVPKDFAAYCQTDSKKTTGMNKEPKIKSSETEPLFKKGKKPLFYELNKDLNKHDGNCTRNITIEQLIQSPEYKDCESKHHLKCEINDLVFGNDYKNIDPLYVRVYKIQGIKIKNAVSTRENLSSCASPCGSDDNLPSKSSYGFEEISKKESKSKFQGNAESVLNLLLSNTPEKKEQKVEPKQDTKTTERIAGNTFTNESIMQTIEASPYFKKPELASPNIRKSDNNDENKTLDHPKIILENCDRIKNENEEEKVRKKEEVSQLTPRMELGDLKEPEIFSNVAEANSIRPKEDSHDSESKKESINSLKKDEEMKISQNEDFPEAKGVNKKKADKKMEEEEVGIREAPIIFGKQDNLSDKHLVPDLKILGLEEKMILNKHPHISKLQCNSVRSLQIDKINRKTHETNSPSQGSLKINLQEKELPGSDRLETQQNDCQAKMSFKSLRSINGDKQKTRQLTRTTKKIIAGLFPDEEDDELAVLNDYNLTEEEIKVRKALLAYEKNKNKELKKKEIKKEENEEKKLKKMKRKVRVKKEMIMLKKAKMITRKMKGRRKKKRVTVQKSKK